MSIFPKMVGCSFKVNGFSILCVYTVFVPYCETRLKELFWYAFMDCLFCNGLLR